MQSNHPTLCSVLVLAACGPGTGSGDGAGASSSTSTASPTTVSTSSTATTTTVTTNDVTTGTSVGTVTTGSLDTGSLETSVGPGSSSGGSSSGGQACTDEIAALAPGVTLDGGGCSVVVRLDHESLEVLGYHAFCSADTQLYFDEQGARALTDCCTQNGLRLNAFVGNNLWVFYLPPEDLGAVAVVADNVAARVFEATIIAQGPGEIGYPTQWASAAELGSGCSPVDLPMPVSYDLWHIGPLDATTVGEVLDVVRGTALPAAMQTGGSSLTRAAVLRYPRTVGGFDPNTAEYIVILENGP